MESFFLEVSPHVDFRVEKTVVVGAEGIVPSFLPSPDPQPKAMLFHSICF